MSFKETDLGLIPEEWKVDSLKNSLYIKGRIGWKGLKKSEYLKESNFRIINGSNITNDNKIDWENCGFISKERYLESPEIMLKENDIVMTKDGTIGKLAIIKNLPGPTTIASGLFLIRVEDPSIDVNYLFYYFRSHFFRGLIHSRIEGSVIPHLYQRDLVNLKLPLPNINEQKAIARILSTLDEKIETNNQINEKLEQIAQALFKHWFVDFEFPNENGEPYKSSGGEMVESELGMIPKGWEALYLNQVVEVKYGRNLPTKDLTDSGYPVFGGNGLIGFYTKYLYKDPQVLIACRGAASGKVLLSLPFSFVTNNSLILENNQKIVSFEYLSQFCLFYEFYNFVTGSAQPQITINNLNKAKILIPNKKLHDEYTNVISALNTKILKLKKETEILKQIRDTLLPKLMSGEIRIPMEDGVLSEKN